MVNGDDTYAARIYNELRGQKRMAWKFSPPGDGEISAAGVEYSLDGIKATLKTPAGDIAIKSPLVGRAQPGEHPRRGRHGAGRGLLAAGTCRTASSG